MAELEDESAGEQGSGGPCGEYAEAIPKLGLRDRTQAVVLAYERGLVVPGYRPPAPPA